MTKPLAIDGVLKREDAERLARESGRTAASIVSDLMHEASRLAHPPISSFRVGAVAVATSGNLYLGANYEIADQQLCFTVHAEQSAVANAWMAGENGIERIVVTAPPCGHCRQFLNELVTASSLIVEMPEVTARLDQLLPSAFGPSDLDVATGLMGMQKQNLTIPASDELATQALRAAEMSYAPYSGAHAGVAVRVRSGAIISGAYAENAAFNPSFSPMQVVLSQMNLRGLGAVEIEEAVLVQTGSLHTAATRLVLAAVSKVPLRLVEAVKQSPPPAS